MSILWAEEFDAESPKRHHVSGNEARQLALAFLCEQRGFSPFVRVSGHQKQVGPELFRVFYTIWKETEAEAQEVCVNLILALLAHGGNRSATVNLFSHLPP